MYPVSAKEARCVRFLRHCCFRDICGILIGFQQTLVSDAP